MRTLVSIDAFILDQVIFFRKFVVTVVACISFEGTHVGVKLD